MKPDLHGRLINESKHQSIITKKGLEENRKYKLSLKRQLLLFVLEVFRCFSWGDIDGDIDGSKRTSY